VQGLYTEESSRELRNRDEADSAVGSSIAGTGFVSGAITDACGTAAVIKAEYGG